MLPLACQGINITRVLYFASWGVTNHVWHAKQLDQTAPDILFTCPALTNYEFPVPTGRYCQYIPGKEVRSEARILPYTLRLYERRL